MSESQEPQGQHELQITKKKKKAARVQIDPENVPTEEDERSGGVYNIWYQQWSGGDSAKSYYHNKPALGRCDPKKDSGYTKGDKIQSAHFCLNFARGICPNGKKCTRLHRIPSVEDIFPPSVDCFSRRKHANYKEDMSGVGSFLRQNRTLYVAQIGDKCNEEIISRHFSQFGDIDRVRVITSRKLAFVTYMNENSAQFAKEAMNRQALDGGKEILTVKWAAEDPNPESQQREKRRLEEQAAEAIRKLLPEQHVKELEGDPEAVKRRKIEGSYGLEGYQASDEVWYAETDPTVEVPVEEEEQAATEQKQIEAPKESLFSSSTLSSVKNIHASVASESEGAASQPQRQQPASGLVDYGSDSE